MSRQRALLRFRLVPIAVSVLARHRLDAHPLLHRVGLPEGAAGDPIYVPLGKVIQFLDGCAGMIGDPLFGWHLADHVPLGTYGLIEFVMRTSGTLRDGIAALCRYGGLINGVTNFEVLERGAEIAFGFSVPGERAATGVQLNEYTLHYMLRTISLFSGGRPAVNAIELAHTRRDARVLEAQLDATPVRFGAPSCRIWLPRRTLDATSPLSDPALHRFLAQQLDTSFAAEASDDSVRAVRDTLVTRLGSATLGVRAVARHLAVSERTLQRRLRSAGTSFREVVDLVRQERARQLILVESLSIAEIATRLGYEAPVVFARAFRRWTGALPSEHRKRALLAVD